MRSPIRTPIFSLLIIRDALHTHYIHCPFWPLTTINCTFGRFSTKYMCVAARWQAKPLHQRVDKPPTPTLLLSHAAARHYRMIRDDCAARGQHKAHAVYMNHTGRGNTARRQLFACVYYIHSSYIRGVRNSCTNLLMHYIMRQHR